MNNDKIVFVLSKLITHYENNDPTSQALYVAYLEHAKPQFTAEQQELIKPIYERCNISDLSKLGKEGWCYRNWTLDAIGADVAKQLHAMELDHAFHVSYKLVTDFASKHEIAITL